MPTDRRLTQLQDAATLVAWLNQPRLARDEEGLIPVPRRGSRRVFRAAREEHVRNAYIKQLIEWLNGFGHRNKNRRNQLRLNRTLWLAVVAPQLVVIAGQPVVIWVPKDNPLEKNPHIREFRRMLTRWIQIV